MNLDLYILNQELVPLGLLDKFTGLIWTERFSSLGSFELWCELNSETLELVKEDNFVWIGGTKTGLIEYKELIKDESGNKSLHIQGRLSECLLSFRTIYPQISYTGDVIGLLVKLLNDNLITPLDPSRSIPIVTLGEVPEDLGQEVSYQKLGGNLNDEIASLCDTYNLGYSLGYSPGAKSLSLQILKGKDRSLQGSLDSVILSSELSDLIDSSYSYNKSELCNLAYVGGEEPSEDEPLTSRKFQIVGESQGLQRRELFIDAKDIKSENEEGALIPDNEYLLMLKERGLNELSSYPEVQTYQATLRTFGTPTYEFNKDFFLGDKVTLQDKELGLDLDINITEVTQTWDESGYSMDLTFGYQQLTLQQKIKRGK